MLALSLIGTLLVWAATEPGLAKAGEDTRTYLMKQLLNIALGLAFMIAVALLDYRQLRLYAPVLYGVSCLGLLVVLTPLGSIVNGAYSWISLPGGFQIEPSEYAKLSIILMTAMLLGELRQGEKRPRLRAAGYALGFAAVPIVLVEAEPDLGVVILMLALMIGLIALSGIRLHWLAAGLAAAVLAVVAVINLHLIRAYQLDRLTAFLHPSADPQGTGYSAAQAKIAIGDGGWLGQGLFHGAAGGRELRARAAHRLHLRRRGRGAGLRRLRRDHRAAAAWCCCARCASRPARRRPVRHAGGRGRRDLVRRAVLRQHRDDHGHHAGDRPAAAVRLLRRIGHLRRHDRDRALQAVYRHRTVFS